MSDDSKQNIILRGVGSSRGLAIGKVMVLEDLESQIKVRKVGEDGVPGEIARLQDALLATRKQLLEIRKHVEDSINEQAASIFDTHLLIIDEPAFFEKVVSGLRERKINLEKVIRDVMKQYAKVFSTMETSYLQERGADIRDLTNRILRNLEGNLQGENAALNEEVILVAKDLLPSVTATLDKSKILGIATEWGGQTSHAAIIARALEIPAVVGVKGLCDHIQTNDVLLMDGTHGRVVLNPNAEQKAQFGQLEHMREEVLNAFREHRHMQSCTLDGRVLSVSANLELPSHADRVQDSGADGVGLFRTEFLFLSRGDLPDEDEQYEAYREVALAVHPAPVIIRTLDVGGDKLVSHKHMKEQSSSPLGCRGIRLSLARPDIFKTQLRAILRASTLGNIQLMYPMISGVQEIHQANLYLKEAAKELESEGWMGLGDLKKGVMIETPVAAVTSDLLIDHVDFFSLGTNDLIQYTIAVDRMEHESAQLYDPMHPGVLQLIQKTAQSSHSRNKKVSVCGEMAGNPFMLLLLIGLGVEEFSVAPGSVPLIKHLIRSIRFSDVKALAEEALMQTDTKRTKQECRELLKRVAPEIEELFV